MQLALRTLLCTLITTVASTQLYCAHQSSWRFIAPLSLIYRAATTQNTKYFCSPSLLIRFNSTPSQQNIDENNLKKHLTKAFILAMKTKNKNIINSMIHPGGLFAQAKIDITAPLSDKPIEKTFAHGAAYLGDIDSLRSLITAGIPATSIDEEGDTILHAAIRGNACSATDIEKLLFIANFYTSQKTSPLPINQRPVSNWLLTTPNNNGLTPAHLAAIKNRIDLIGLLNEKKVSFNVPDNNGNTTSTFANHKPSIVCVPYYQRLSRSVQEIMNWYPSKSSSTESKDKNYNNDSDDDDLVGYRPNGNTWAYGNRLYNKHHNYPGWHKR